MPNRLAPVWKHYTWTVDKPDEASCNLCKKVLNCKHNTTSGLIKHLKGIHEIDLKPTNFEGQPEAKKPKYLYRVVLYHLLTNKQSLVKCFLSLPLKMAFLYMQS